MATKFIDVHIRLPVTGPAAHITVSAVREDIRHRLRNVGDCTISFFKGTLPDPDTVRTLNIDYGNATVRVRKPQTG
jgi:hypothetical protein